MHFFPIIEHCVFVYIFLEKILICLQFFLIFFPANVEKAKSALNEKVEELEKEEADKALKGFEIKIDVKPEYHPKLIGRGGQVIKQLRSDYDVNIQLPTKGNDNDESTIIITGKEIFFVKLKIF